jgi:hypothetical protein
MTGTTTIQDLDVGHQSDTSTVEEDSIAANILDAIIRTSATTTVKYVCGDSTRLSQYFSSRHEGTPAAVAPGYDDDDYDDDDATDSGTKFDVIIDKGLCDAIWCSEGWDGILEKMFHEVAQVLRRPTTKATTKKKQLHPQKQRTASAGGDQVNHRAAAVSASSAAGQPGRYILVCYKLSKSNKEFLVDLGHKVGLTWQFDIPPPYSNDRVSTSIATLVG